MFEGEKRLLSKYTIQRSFGNLETSKTKRHLRRSFLQKQLSVKTRKTISIKHCTKNEVFH